MKAGDDYSIAIVQVAIQGNDRGYVQAVLDAALARLDVAGYDVLVSEHTVRSEEGDEAEDLFRRHGDIIQQMENDE